MAETETWQKGQVMERGEEQPDVPLDLKAERAPSPQHGNPTRISNKAQVWADKVRGRTLERHGAQGKLSPIKLL